MGPWSSFCAHNERWTQNCCNSLNRRVNRRECAPSKTLMYQQHLGLWQQIDKVTVCDITVLSSSATVDTAQDLGVDRQQPADHVGTRQCGVSVGTRTSTYGSYDLSLECYQLKPWRQWFMHSSLHILTTLTHCCSASLIICTSCYWYSTLWLVSTSCPSCGNFIVCQCDSTLNSSC